MEPSRRCREVRAFCHGDSVTKMLDVAGQPGFSCYNPRAFGRWRSAAAGRDTNPSVRRRYAQIAQLVEQRTENPRVGGSNPPLGTTKLLKYINFLGNFETL
jgi:hypothetical protein